MINSSGKDDFSIDLESQHLFTPRSDDVRSGSIFHESGVGGFCLDDYLVPAFTPHSNTVFESACIDWDEFHDFIHEYAC